MTLAIFKGVEAEIVIGSKIRLRDWAMTQEHNGKFFDVVGFESYSGRDLVLFEDTVLNEQVACDSVLIEEVQQ